MTDFRQDRHVPCRKVNPLSLERELLDHNVQWISDSCAIAMYTHVTSTTVLYIRAVAQHSILGYQTSSWLKSSHRYVSHYGTVLLYRFIWIAEEPCYLHVRAERTNMMSRGTRDTQYWRCLRYARQPSCYSQGWCSTPRPWVIFANIQGSVMDAPKKAV